jgi:hypothetical protein
VLDDFAEFCRWQLASGDVDPAYPVLRSLIASRGYDDATAHEFLFAYVGYYNLPSALEAWSTTGSLAALTRQREVWRMPTGIERRGLRVPDKLGYHLQAVRSFLGDEPRVMLTAGFGDDERANWQALQARLRAIPMNGRWAAYKTGEVLLSVLDYPLEPTDAGHDFSTGPRQGLALLVPDTARITGSTPVAVERLDAATERLRADLFDADVPMPVEQLETMLCDWHGVVDGRYYVGHDIDMMIEQAADLNGPLSKELFDARLAVFDERWLGEINGWHGVRRMLRRLYRDEKRVQWWR